MADSERYDENGNRLSYTGEDRSGREVRSRIATASMGTTAGKGLGSLGARDADMPKQSAGESASEYGERLRAYREKKRDQKATTAQKSALRELK